MKVIKQKGDENLFNEIRDNNANAILICILVYSWFISDIPGYENNDDNNNFVAFNMAIWYDIIIFKEIITCGSY